MDPQGNPVTSRAAILWGGGGLSFVARALAGGPGSSQRRDKQAREERASAEIPQPRGARQDVGLGSDLHNLRVEQTRGASSEEHGTFLQSVLRSLEGRAVKRQQ